MHRSSREAVEGLRARIIRGELDPRTFGALLEAIPVGDRDAWLDLLWDSQELPDDEKLPSGCVPYLPCPVDSVLEALEQAAVSEEDVFVDVGSGLGRTAFLAHLRTGAGCIGLEIQRGLVRAARARAEWLGLSRVGFVEGDAEELVRFMTTGTVFFLYCPFGGERLRRVLDDLRSLAQTREIRVCCVSLPPLQLPWLVPLPSTSLDVDVYRSTLHPAEAVRGPATVPASDRDRAR